MRISDFTGGRTITSIVGQAMEKSTIAAINEGLVKYYKKLLEYRRGDETVAQLLNEFAVAGLIIGNYYLYDQIYMAKNLQERNAKQSLLIDTVFKMLVLIIDQEMKNTKGVGIDKIMCDSVAQRLLAAYDEISKMKPKDLKPLYAEFLGIPEKKFGVCTY